MNHSSLLMGPMRNSMNASSVVADPLDNAQEKNADLHVQQSRLDATIQEARIQHKKPLTLGEIMRDIKNN